MYASYFIKKPFIALAILMVFIAVKTYQQKRSAHPNKRFSTKSCQATLVRLKNARLENWKAFCTDNLLEIEIIEEKIFGQIRPAAYRETANILTLLSKKIFPFNEQKVAFHPIKIKIFFPQIEITAHTASGPLNQLATLNNPKLIAEQLQRTVKIQEKLK